MTLALRSRAMADADAAAAYAAAALRASPGCAPLLRHLLRLQACARCALRFAAVQGGVYAQPAPSREALLAALPPAAEASADGPAVAATEAADAERICPCCWGCLQGAEGPADAAAGAGRVRGAEPGGGAARVPAGTGSAASLAAAVAASGFHAAAGLSLEVSAPAVLGAVAAAQLAALRRDAPSLAPKSAPTQLRDALRAALAARLAAAAGAPLARDAGPLRCAAAFSHPRAAQALAFLRLPPPQRAGGKRPRWGGGRGGGRGGRFVPEPPAGGGTALEAAEVADAAYNAAARAAAALPPAELLSGVGDAFASPDAPCGCVLTVSREPLCVGGYYVKHLRGLSQSPWLADGGDVGDGSVAADIEAVVMPLLRADSAKFTGAGREDMDVRMLGGGRPFVIEAANARAAPPSAEALAAASASLAAGGRVTVRQLSVLTKAQRALLREGEAEKSKAYRAVVSLSRPFTPADAAALASRGRVTLAQATPVRVLHRRAALTRERDVLSLAARALDGHPRAFVLDLRCAAGTYVKEFVHGDFGRTRPCLADLLDPAAPRATADCIQLDVVSVEMDWI